MACDSSGIQEQPQHENPQDIMLSQLLMGFGIFPVAFPKAMAKAKGFPSTMTRQEKTEFPITAPVWMLQHN